LEWLDTEMEKYLCPDTLFGTKFEKYLNQNITNYMINHLKRWAGISIYLCYMEMSIASQI